MTYAERLKLDLVGDEEKLARYDICIEVLRETIEEHYAKSEVLMDLRYMLLSALDSERGVGQCESLLNIVRTILKDYYSHDIRMTHLYNAIGRMLGSEV